MRRVGYIYTTYNTLSNTFGNESGLHDCYKSMHQFDIENNESYPDKISIYDWKGDFCKHLEENNFSDDLGISIDRYYWWHVGANNKNAITFLSNALNLQDNEYRYD